MEAVLFPYDPAWPDVFRRVAAELRTLGNPNWIVEHIGSTSIPGMSAKYNAGKTAVIQLLVDRARAARGLLPVSVYDKD